MLLKMKDEFYSDTYKSKIETNDDNDDGDKDDKDANWKLTTMMTLRGK